MPLLEKTLSLVGTERNTIRDEIIMKFLQEPPGTGKKDKCSRVFYTVEDIHGLKILLRRPAPLNKGFDFIVITDVYLFKKNNRRHKDPSHADIIDSLIYCKQNYPAQYNDVINEINNVFNNCNPSNITTNNIGFFKDYQNNLHPIQIIIYILKWLFIEQDMTYWNWSGRQMFYDTLHTNNLV